MATLRSGRLAQAELLMMTDFSRPYDVQDRQAGNLPSDLPKFAQIEAGAPEGALTGAVAGRGLCHHPECCKNLTVDGEGDHIRCAESHPATWCCRRRAYWRGLLEWNLRSSRLNGRLIYSSKSLG